MVLKGSGSESDEERLDDSSNPGSVIVDGNNIDNNK